MLDHSNLNKNTWNLFIFALIVTLVFFAKSSAEFAVRAFKTGCSKNDAHNGFTFLLCSYSVRLPFSFSPDKGFVAHFSSIIYKSNWIVSKYFISSQRAALSSEGWWEEGEGWRQGEGGRASWWDKLSLPEPTGVRRCKKWLFKKTQPQKGAGMKPFWGPNNRRDFSRRGFGEGGSQNLLWNERIFLFHIKRSAKRPVSYRGWFSFFILQNCGWSVSVCLQRRVQIICFENTCKKLTRLLEAEQRAEKHYQLASIRRTCCIVVNTASVTSIEFSFRCGV